MRSYKESIPAKEGESMVDYFHKCAELQTQQLWYREMLNEKKQMEAARKARTDIGRGIFLTVLWAFLLLVLLVVIKF